MFPLTWSSTAVQALFNKSISNSSTPSTSPSASPSTQTSSPDSVDHKHKPRVIVGLVVGIVVAIALLTIGLLLFRRKSKRRAEKTVNDPPIPPLTEPKRNPIYSEMSVTEQRSELPDSRPWLEMPAIGPPAEMAAEHRR